MMMDTAEAEPRGKREGLPQHIPAPRQRCRGLGVSWATSAIMHGARMMLPTLRHHFPFRRALVATCWCPLRHHQSYHPHPLRQHHCRRHLQAGPLRSRRAPPAYQLNHKHHHHTARRLPHPPSSCPHPHQTLSRRQPRLTPRLSTSGGTTYGRRTTGPTSNTRAPISLLQCDS
jgi:hypothetical protein